MTPLSEGLREAIARALHHDWHADEEWDAIPDSVQGYYRRLADVTLALPELAALRAKPDAVDRVRALHHPWRDLPICQECTDEITVGWPCPTLDALDGPPC